MADTPYEDFIQRVRGARLVVVPLTNTTQYGAGCTAVLEASAAGKAVVATRTMGTIDYVQDGVTGYLVPVGDVAAMRAAISRLWHNPAWAAQMGRAGRTFVEDRFSPKQVNDGIRQALIAAAERRGVR